MTFLLGPPLPGNCHLKQRLILTMLFLGEAVSYTCAPWLDSPLYMQFFGGKEKISKTAQWEEIWGASSYVCARENFLFTLRNRKELQAFHASDVLVKVFWSLGNNVTHTGLVLPEHGYQKELIRNSVFQAQAHIHGTGTCISESFRVWDGIYGCYKAKC